MRALNAVQIRVTIGTRASVLKFFGHFDPSPIDGIALTVRKGPPRRRQCPYLGSVARV